MIKAESIDFHHHLPPYRSLLNPNARYDYRTHQLIPLSQNDLNFLHSIFRNGGRSTPLLLNGDNQSNKNNSKNNYNNNNKYKNNSFTNDNINRNNSQYNRQNHQQSQRPLSRSRFNNANSNYCYQSSQRDNEDDINGHMLHDCGSNVNTTDLPPSTASSSSSIKSGSTSNFLFANNNRNNQSTPFKMKYRSLLNDVGRTISLRLSNSNLIANTIQHSSTIGSISRSSTILGTAKQPTVDNIINLPIEVLDYIFYFVDDKSDYKSCLFTCKLFYHMAKPYCYENLEFTSTYRFAQFISYLRLNSEIGQFVKKIDLSGIKPGYDGDAEIEESQINETNGETDTIETEISPSNKVYAGWRDWKFKNNPLYTNHPSPNALSKIRSNASNSQVSIVSSKSNSSQKSSSSKKFAKPFKYFKSRKRSRPFNSGRPKTRKTPRLEYLKLPPNAAVSGSDKYSTPHPYINKFLLNYSTSKDVPIGYILHMINLCPNVTSLNLGNLSLSTDYEITRSTIHKYQNFDLMNNYPKDLLSKIENCSKFDGINNLVNSEVNNIFNSHHLFTFKPHASNVSTSSSIYSVTTFSKPIRKYNSLLPPLPQTLSDISYLNKGDKKVYLSDLNLKSINNTYLKKLDEVEVLRAITRNHGKRVLSYNYDMNQQQQPIDADVSGSLKYLNLSSMIWLNRTLIEKFLKKLLTKRSNNLTAYGFYDNDEFSKFGKHDYDGEEDKDHEFQSDNESESDSDSDEDEENKIEPIVYKQDLIIDLTDSGMYKNLLWAKILNFNTLEGCKLAKKIICNELKTPFEEFMIRERNRRGRLGENYLA
ncbi:COS111 [Candida pseudojiufengensis]|uniref:COS111 n=1 Tax=Candida pseudojiufengensis TaxID=497109 RepID=UPI0022253917|nr:COS111 [Candida pseudojiufengensis]KAI5963793.1 COS111 [Candida pseudojiufengensis]